LWCTKEKKHHKTIIYHTFYMCKSQMLNYSNVYCLRSLYYGKNKNKMVRILKNSIIQTMNLKHVPQ